MNKAMDEKTIAAWCVDYISKTLNMSPASIGVDDDFDTLGLDSAITTAMLIELEEWLDADIPPSVAFLQRTLRDMAAAILDCRRSNPVEPGLAARV